ncbi:MAG TPA: PQQ-binding-like beta-propeller repeat protein, partial [Vicinamibacterales bacterium]
RVKIVAPLVADGGWLLALTGSEILAIRDADGTVIWHKPTGGARLPLAPAIDGNTVYLGAGDGGLSALSLQTGGLLWQKLLPGGVTAIAAGGGRVFAGAGDKQFYAFDGATGNLVSGWPWRIGAFVVGHIAIDEDHVYFAALDNVVRALDRDNGNQRWERPLNERPASGVYALGHLVFVPSPSASDLPLLYAKDGHPSGTLALPALIPPALPPALKVVESGLHIVAVTNSLSNTWQLTLIAPDPEPPLAALTEVPGIMVLTDPEVEPPAKALFGLLASDPPVMPLSDVDWPILLSDPPLGPFTALPGLELRPLSPTLPIRRAAPLPGG